MIEITIATTVTPSRHFGSPIPVCGISEMRFMDATPHVAQNANGRRSRIDARTTRHAGYAVSQVKRKRIEEIFGWLKTVALLRKLRHRNRPTVEWIFIFAVAA